MSKVVGRSAVPLQAEAGANTLLHIVGDRHSDKWRQKFAEALGTHKSSLKVFDDGLDWSDLCPGQMM